MRAVRIPSTTFVRLYELDASKVFLVTVMNCENRSHAREIARLLRDFPHRDYGTADETSISSSMMVKTDGPASIQTVIAPALGKANAAIREMSFFVRQQNVT